MSKPGSDERAPRGKRSSWRRRVGLTLVTLVAVVVAYGSWLWWQVPSLENLTQGPAPLTSYMVRDAELTRTPAVAAAFTPLHEVSPLAACAIVKAEDAHFFAHAGFDWQQVRAAISARGTRGGASTITQQLARNLYLTGDRTLHRKLSEAVLSVRLERELPKERLLELYLNVVELGPRVWGVTAASEHYFDKRPAELDAYEGAFLSSMLPAPKKAPSGANGKRMLDVQSRVLVALFQSGLIDEAAYAGAWSRALVVADALDRGVGMVEAVRLPMRTADASKAPLRRRKEPLALDRAIELSCGYARELAEMKP